MANILYANNAAGTLSAGITNVATALTLGAGQGAIFPNPSPPQVFYVTLTDAATQTLIEIVQVTARAGDVFTIVRGQDGTTPLSWNAGDIVSLRVIRLELQGFENAAEGLFGTTGQNVQIVPSTTLGIKGTALADNANTGAVGEFLTAVASAVLPGSAVPTAVVSMFLTAGDWDVQAFMNYRPAPGVTVVATVAQAGVTAAVLTPLGSASTHVFAAASAAQVSSEVSPMVRINVSVTTAIFGNAQASFSGGACAVDGIIRARRVR